MMTFDINNHLSANREWFFRCFDTPAFAQWAYKSRDHLLKDMEHPKYFAAFHQRLESGDHIVCIDGAMEMRTYVVDYIDKEAGVVQMSVLHHMELRPIMQEGAELQWKWRGPRGGGHCIVDQNNKVIERDFNSRQSAIQEIERRKMREQVAAEQGEDTPEAA
jgi:hypothetical protein